MPVATARRTTPVIRRLATAFAKLLTRIVLFDSYRPERYYMRGPGPRWHAKHDSVPGVSLSYRHIL
jgi:hypothetical protein